MIMPKLLKKNKNGNQSIDKVQTLLNDESNEIIDRSPTTSQLVDKK